MRLARRDILIWVLLSGGTGTLLGTLLETTSYAPMLDFKAVYYGARCLIHHHDPYNPTEFQATYQAAGEELPADPAKSRVVKPAIFACVNVPTSLFLVTPLALLPWGAAHLLWMALTAGGLMLVAFVILEYSGQYAPGSALFLVGIVLADMGSLILLGNLAGVAISLCVFAVWCFLSDRWIAAAIMCLALALMLKPHDTGFVWFYFVLAGNTHRKHALQVLLVIVVLALPAALWLSHIAPLWPQEQYATLTAGSIRGGLNDPGPTSLSFHSADGLTNLQSAFSVFRDDPCLYDPASYFVCGLLFLIGAIRVARTHFSQGTAWFALAAIASLSMLPVYHRAYDAKLLLLTIPACALLWAEGGAIRWVAFFLTSGATGATGATSVIPSTFLLGICHDWAEPGGESLRHVLPIAQAQLAPLSLLAVGIFYLYVYWSRTAVHDEVPTY